MCGISAIVSEHTFSEFNLASMNREISHRGPDDEGFYVYSKVDSSFELLKGDDTPINVCKQFSLDKHISEYESTASLSLGHRRLSIRDLSPKGHQPMLSSCSRYTLVYNGEIYNSEAIREELIVLGYSFQSDSDTEVLLYGIVEWREKVLDKLNGMFSFIAFDSQTEDVFVARDRFGIKPLYYWALPTGGLAFGSEIKQFTCLNGWSAELNGPMALDFLNWGQTDHTEETMFKGVFHVPPGHYARFNLKSVPNRPSFVRWYEIKKSKYKGSFEEATVEFERLFVDSVSLRLKADVPVGTCLSGGLDSSSIVCVVNSLIKQGQVQKTFSSCSEHKRFDEREFVHEVLNKTKNVDPCLFNLEHGNFADLISDIVYQQDEPFLSPSVFAEWSVFEKVKQGGVTVTLDGHGADEQLIGYHTFYGSHLFTLFKKFRFIKLISEIMSLKRLHGYGLGYSLRKILRGILPNSLNQLLFKMTNRPTSHVVWINQDKLNASESTTEFSSELVSVSDLSLEQLTKTSLPKQLRWCDRDSMAHSIESRVPFLDYRIVEFLASLPESYKLDNGITKRVLRSAMKEYLPSRVTNRIDKMGFVTPAEIWVRSDKEKYKNIVDKAIASSRGVLTKESEKKFKDMIDGKAQFDHSFWRAVFFSTWLEVYSVKV